MKEKKVYVTGADRICHWIFRRRFPFESCDTQKSGPNKVSLAR